MDFSTEQDAALKSISRWLKRGNPQVFRLFGYAGTGKTTLARHVAEHVDGDVLFAAFTGKAALVMRSRGATGASTIHSLIYRPRGEELVEDEKGKSSMAPLFSLNRDSIVSRASLIVIDECSMVDEEIGRDLLSFGRPVLVLGDPGQLPPVSGGGFFTNSEPDIMLEDIHRQARDNPIVDLAHMARQGEQIPYGDYGESRVVRRSDLDQEIVLSADQVLVGTNKTRRMYNQRLRELKDFQSVFPEAGDKLVALRNDPARGLLNGSLWTTVSAPSSRRSFMNLLIRSEDEGLEKQSAKIKLLKVLFEDPDADVPWKTRRRYDDFDYGYALTVHKSQGSQWQNVCLFDESYAFREHSGRWLYTAITRACDKLTLVQ